MSTTHTDDSDCAARPSRRMEVMAAVFCVAFTGLVVIGADSIEVRTETGGVGPRSWPTMLGLAGLGLSLALLVVSAVRRPVGREDLEVVNRGGALRCVSAVVLAGAYVIAWDVTDFRLMTPVFLATVVAVFGGRTWQSLLLYPVLTTAGIYLLFHTMLQVPL